LQGSPKNEKDRSGNFSLIHITILLGGDPKSKGDEFICPKACVLILSHNRLKIKHFFLFRIFAAVKAGQVRIKHKM